MNKVSRLATPILALTVASLLLACGKAKVDEEKTAELIQPVAKIELSAQPERTGPMSGEDVVKQVCAACHGTGALGSPKIGDKAAWGPRVAQGIAVLDDHALKGKGSMPPKGGNAALSDDEVKAAVEFLVSQVK